MKLFSRATLVALVLSCAGGGCTTMSLERRTVNQIHSVADQRYRQTLHCLATVAAQPESLASYCLVTAGTTRITDQGALAPSTLWMHLVPKPDKGAIPISGFASQNLGLTLSRQPTENWTLVPVTDHSQLEAIRCACQWVIYGPECACSSCPGLLASPDDDPSHKGPHFDVAQRLRKLPPGWLHVGRLKDVPGRAAYCGHHGATWVWVMPDGFQGLADFTLALQDIATLDTSASTAPRSVITLEWLEDWTATTEKKKENQYAISCIESRVVKADKVPDVQKYLFFDKERELGTVPWEELTTPLPATRVNTSPTGPSPDFAALRSVISAQRLGGANLPQPPSPFTPLTPSPHSSPFTPLR